MHTRIGVFSSFIATCLILLSAPLFSSAASQSLIAALIATSTPAAPCPQLPLLSYGATDASTHGAVSELQQFLATVVASSSTAAATSTGFFGPVTRARLRAFQQEGGLKVSGLVDAPTAAAIAAFCRSEASSTAATAAPAASIAFDEGQSFTSLRADPILTGTVQGISSPLRLVVHPDGASGVEAAVYENDAVPVSSDGRWSVHVFPSLPNGPYLVDVYASSTVLAALPMQVGLVSFPTMIPEKFLAAAKRCRRRPPAALRHIGTSVRSGID